MAAKMTLLCKAWRSCWTLYCVNIVFLTSPEAVAVQFASELPQRSY